MIRGIVAGIIALTSILTFYMSSLFGSDPVAVLPATIYEFRINSLEGKPIDFEQYRGKYLLIVNTASKCGYTPQYADLQKLSEMYPGKIAVLGFPANNFLWQEPGSNHDIAEFCQQNYGVTFQMFEKVSVKGRHKHALYQWLTEKSGETPSWNFCKYLIDPQGNFVGFFGPKTNPLDAEITKKIL
jgi:glutathione peroxidase